MKNKNGFTLIELMVTIAVIAIVSAIGIPNMISWMSDRRIQSTVNEISALVQLSRQRAIRENEDVVINLAGDGGEIFIDANNNHARDGSETIIETIDLPAGVDLNGNTFTGGWFGYTERGLPIDSKEGEIRLKNNDGRYMGVQVDITGNPTIIQSNNGSSWY